MVLSGSEGPQIKLLDFGLALARSHVQVKPRELLGTLSYMAPELFEGRPASEASDLFAVGVLAYELFARRHPFDRGDDAELIGSILRSEPDWEPLRKHEALLPVVRRLLAKAPAERPSADDALHELSRAAGLPPPKETAALRESTLQAARFVGREEPMAMLRAALDAVARSGAGETRLIGGESGVGKSRLMEELRVYSLVAGALSARGQATSESSEAYGVWREILRTLCIYADLDELEASVLKSLLPDLEVLLERAIPDAPALDPRAAQLRLFNVIEAVLLRQSEPLLLLLEDIHWADAESLALLRRLVPLSRTRPILMVASYRDDERPLLPKDVPGCPVLKLPRLTSESITQLCKSMLGEKGYTAELASFLEAETEGNVFFIIEVLRALAEEAGQLSLVASHRLPQHVLTGNILSIVQRRLARLPEHAHPLLRLAAVAGRQLDLALLRHFEPQLEPWLYLAADAAVLEANAQTWRFAHDKIRESLLLALDPAERQRLHLELAQALEQTYPGSAPHAAAIAEHYQRGGDPTKATFFQVEAGIHALSQGSNEHAVALLAQALSAEAHSLLSRVQAARAYNGLVQATIAQGQFVPCLTTYEKFCAACGIHMPENLGSLASTGTEMLARYLHAVPGLRFDTDEERRLWSEFAQATRWAVEAYAWSSLPIQTLSAAVRGIEISAALGERALHGYFLAACSYTAGVIPLRGLSRRLFDQANRLIEGAASSRIELSFRHLAGALQMNNARWEEARFHLDALIQRARQVGDEYSLMSGLSWRAIVAFRQEDEETFATSGTELVLLAHRNRSHQFARIFPLYRGIKALRSGEGETALRLLTEAAGHVEKSQDMTGKLVVWGPLAHSLFLCGKEQAALTRAEQTLAILRSARFTTEVVGEGISGVLAVYFGLWEVGDEAKRKQLTAPLFAALSAMRRCARSFPAFVSRALIWHGRAAWSQGATQLAQRLAAASLRSACSLGMPHEQALARTWLQRFSAPPPGLKRDLAAEARGALALFANSLSL